MWLAQVAGEPQIVDKFLQYGILGAVTLALGLRFLKTSDEDRKWIREDGERKMVLMEQMSQTNQRLIAIIERLEAKL